MSVGVGIGVFVLVEVGIGVWVRVGGFGVFVRDGMNVTVRVICDRLVRVGVTVKKRLGVDVEVSEGCREGESVFVGTSVGVGTNEVTACSVSAAAVSMLATAMSTRFSGASVTRRIWLFKSPIAIEETLHNSVKPIAPATRTPKGPAYSLAFTLVALLGDLERSPSDCSRRSDGEIIPHFCF